MPWHFLHVEAQALTAGVDFTMWQPPATAFYGLQGWKLHNFSAQATLQFRDGPGGTVLFATVIYPGASNDGWLYGTTVGGRVLGRPLVIRADQNITITGYVFGTEETS